MYIISLLKDNCIIQSEHSVQMTTSYKALVGCGAWT